MTPNPTMFTSCTTCSPAPVASANSLPTPNTPNPTTHPISNIPTLANALTGNIAVAIAIPLPTTAWANPTPSPIPIPFANTAQHPNTHAHANADTPIAFHNLCPRAASSSAVPSPSTLSIARAPTFHRANPNRLDAQTPTLTNHSPLQLNANNPNARTMAAAPSGTSHASPPETRQATPIHIANVAKSINLATNNTAIPVSALTPNTFPAYTTYVSSPTFAGSTNDAIPYASTTPNCAPSPDREAPASKTWNLTARNTYAPT